MGGGARAPTMDRCAVAAHRPPTPINIIQLFGVLSSVPTSMPTLLSSRPTLRRAFRGPGSAGASGITSPSTTFARSPGKRASNGGNRLDACLQLLIRHRLHAAGMLDFHFARHQHCADFQIRSRRLASHPRQHLLTMRLKISRQRNQEILVGRPPRRVAGFTSRIKAPSAMSNTPTRSGASLPTFH